MNCFIIPGVNTSEKRKHLIIYTMKIPFLVLALNRKLLLSHCVSSFDLSSLVRSMAVIHEIQQVNAAGFLPGLRLGYLLCDTCSYASKALLNAEHMLAFNRSNHLECDNSDFRPAVKVVLGAQYSEVTIALAKLLNVYMVPLVGHRASTSPELSDKLLHPAFIRTVPSDIHQTKAIASIMSYYDWNWVGVVYGDDDYGKAAFQSFLWDAEENGVCLSYQETLHHYLDHSQNDRRIQQVAEVIRSSRAQVVLLILKAELVELLFKEMLKTNTSRVWIASDAWSRSSAIAQMDGINEVGDILGFTFVSFRSQSFDDFLTNLTVTEGGYNFFIEEYKNLRSNCSAECGSSNPPSKCVDLLKYACDSSYSPDQKDDYLLKATDTSEPFPHRVAVWAVAHALKKLLRCNNKIALVLLFWFQLLQELKNIRFEFENQMYFFDKNGDFVNGYDLILWEKHGSGRRLEKFGKYSILNNRIELDGKEFTWLSTENVSTPQSRCSESCRPGWVKKILNISCCYTCIEYVQDCKTCPNETWSLKGYTHCRPRSEFFLRWTEPHPLTMIAAAAFGVLLLLVILVIFLVYRNSLPMKQAEVRLSCVMMAGLAVSFASVVLFMGRPTVHICRARQTMYAMGFTLCVSCILVKAYRTFLAFLPFGQLLHKRLHKLYKPPVIIVVLTSLQAVICLLWLIFDSPDVDDKPPSAQSMRKVLECKEGNTYIGFGVMLGYIALLALIGFLLAFKGRKVPQEFSETGYIIFSMLMYLFVWVCFIPVYITSEEDGTRVQASAILVSSYGIIFCHFLPKCYAALWASKSDTMENILDRWRAKSEKEDRDGATPPSERSVTLSTTSTSSFLWRSETQSTITSRLSDVSCDSVCFPPLPSRSGSVVTKRTRSLSL
uniref:Olfactory receptor C family, b1 n=1 Tax=Salarias fasciatus TaxID=181472 RepID=A0A672FLH6_SALFA